MKRQILYVAVLVLAAACRREQASPPEAQGAPPAKVEPQDMSKTAVNKVIAPSLAFLDRCLLGSKVAADGTVSEDESKFKIGERVQLTIWLKESPEGLQMVARWYDDKEKLVSEQRKPMNGAKVVNFELDKKLEQGEYRVEGYWGGNFACEYRFTIVK